MEDPIGNSEGGGGGRMKDLRNNPEIAQEKVFFIFPIDIYFKLHRNYILAPSSIDRCRWKYGFVFVTTTSTFVRIQGKVLGIRA